MEFRVWAPNADVVGLALRGARLQMRRAANDWWEAEADGRPGDDYAFFLDGAGPLPDPRSPFQPHGVEGASRVVDHGAFRWSDAAFSPPPLAEWVIYELHVGTFTPDGTFDGAIGKLDHLVDLGVTAVELCPVNEFPGNRGWGYDGVDLYAPHHAYGGPERLKRFVDACHSRGLATILDVVYNHLGPEGNHLPRFGPYVASAHSTPWGSAVNLDGPGSDEVRSFFVDNALMWLDDYRFDALRLDATHAYRDHSALHFLDELAKRVDDLEARLGAPRYLIAESLLNDPRLLQPRDEGGMGIDAEWSDDFHHALHAVLTTERNGYYVDFGRVADLATALRQAYVIDGRYSIYRRRKHGRPVGNLPGDRFVTYMQNHDQVGNRAAGDRISHLVSPGLVKVGAALTLTSPFVPLIFQGEEWAASTPFQYFTNHSDPRVATMTREGRLRDLASFGWRPEEAPDPQDPETFHRSKLDWAELDKQEHHEMREWYGALIRLRKEVSGLHEGNMEIVRATFDEIERWLVLERGPIIVACNFSAGPVSVPLPDLRGDVVLTSEEPGGADRLAPESVTIWRR